MCWITKTLNKSKARIRTKVRRVGVYVQSTFSPHFHMLELISVSHAKSPLFSLYSCGCVHVYSPTSLHEHSQQLARHGQLSLSSHWLAPPCKHTPTCCWFIFSSTHSVGADHSPLTEREGEGRCVSQAYSKQGSGRVSEKQT